MLTFVRVIPAGTNSAAPVGRIRLGFEKRCVSRQRVCMEDGIEAGLILPRGTVLKDGDVVLTEEGLAAEIKASREELSEAVCPDAQGVARLAYHLGNRHAVVMVGDGFIRYPRDPVLDRMTLGLGFTVNHVEAAFQPEAGAYGFTPGDAMISLLSKPVAIRKPGASSGQISSAGAIGAEGGLTP